MDIKIKDVDDDTKFKDEYIVVAIDSTGIKVTNRGQWTQDKWNLKNNNKKGYLKIHVAVNVKTKKILSMKVTDEHVHDNKALPELVDGAIKSNNMTSTAAAAATTTTTIGKLFADGGAYDSNDMFEILAENGILSCIKARKNSIVRWRKGNVLRNLSVLAQRNDLQRWKDSVRYGQQRWL